MVCASSNLIEQVFKQFTHMYTHHFIHFEQNLNYILIRIYFVNSLVIL